MAAFARLVDSPGRWAAELTIAAAAMGSAELLVVRVLSPLVEHVPPLSSAVGTHTESLFGLVRDGVGSATAVLVLAAAAFWIAVEGRRDRVAGGALLLAFVAVVSITILAGGTGQAAARFLLVLGVAALASAAAARLTPLHAAAICAAALSVSAAHVPLLVDSLSGHGTPVGWSELAEGTRIAMLVLLALAIVRRGTVPSSALAAAAIGTIVASVVLAREPSSVAILSTWAVGATLALPAPLYIVASGCAAFVLVASLREPGARHVAIGLLLLTVAGVQPSLVHHNVTAVLALSVLAQPFQSAVASRHRALAVIPKNEMPLIRSGSATAAAE